MTCGALPAPSPQLSPCLHPTPGFLTCLIYLFDASLNVSAWVPTFAFAARPRVSGLAMPHSDSACLRLFSPFLALSYPITPTLATHLRAKGEGMYIGTHCGVPPPSPEGRGLVYNCNIQSIVKNLFKMREGCVAGTSCRLHEHFLLVHGLDLYELPLNIAAPASLQPQSAGIGKGPRRQRGRCLVCGRPLISARAGPARSFPPPTCFRP